MTGMNNEQRMLQSAATNDRILSALEDHGPQSNEQLRVRLGCGITEAAIRHRLAGLIKMQSVHVTYVGSGTGHKRAIYHYGPEDQSNGYAEFQRTVQHWTTHNFRHPQDIAFFGPARA